MKDRVYKATRAYGPEDVTLGYYTSMDRAHQVCVEDLVAAGGPEFCYHTVEGLVLNGAPGEHCEYLVWVSGDPYTPENDLD